MYRKGNPSRITTLTGLFIMLAALFVPLAPALAAVKPGRSIEVFYGIKMVGLHGYPANTEVLVEVLRGPDDVVIGKVLAPTDNTGLLEINHLGEGSFADGGDCWDVPATPDIQPGDTVRTTIIDNPTDQDSTVVRDIFIDENKTEVDTSANTITMYGSVRSLENAPLSVETDVVELRLNANGFNWQTNSNRRDLRAQVDLADFEADGDGDPATFKHVFRVSAADANNAKTRGFEQMIEWATASLRELTIFDGVTGALPGCPPLATYAVTSNTPAAINAGNVGGDLVVSGVAQDASLVSVSLDDQDPNTAALSQTATPAPASGAQAWSVTFPGAEVATLGDGTLTATGSYTKVTDPATDPPTTATIGGTNLTILKDTVVPSGLKATPPGGIYNQIQTVSLSANEPATFFYTFGSTPPNETTGIKYTGPINISTNTTLNFMAVDAAGNRSQAVTHVYTFDTVAPVVTIDAKPTNPTYDPVAHFVFSANEGATFECSLSFGRAADQFVPCQSSAETPAEYSLLNGDGTYTFKVRATDTAGNTSDAVAYTFMLDTRLRLYVPFVTR